MRLAEKPLTLSLVIPVYNEEGYIGACLEAIAGQTEPPDEVIVVDNNSTDRSAEIARSFPFVKVVAEPVQGLRAARDRGIQTAKGQIIGRFDADTRLLPEWSAQARQTFADGKIAGAVGPVWYYDMPLKKTLAFFDRWIRKVLYGVNGSPVLFGSNMVFRRSAWDRVQPELCRDGEFFEDYDLTLHLREKGCKLVYVPQMKVGTSTRRLDDAPREFLRTMSFHTKTFARHNQRPLFAVASKYIYLLLYLPAKGVRSLYHKNPGKPRPSANT